MRFNSFKFEAKVTIVLFLWILHNIGGMLFGLVVRDEDEDYDGTVPELTDCHAQAKSLDELMSRIKSYSALFGTDG